VTWLVALVALVLRPFAVGYQPAVRVAVTVQVAPPPPAGVDVPDSARCGQWWDLALEVGWPADVLPDVDRVMWCESMCEPDAHNPSGAAGLLQLMPMHWHGRDPYDPAVNLSIALDLWRDQGWHPWSCR